MKPLRCYISGPVTGMADHNQKAFNDAEELLKENFAAVINPLRISNLFGGLAKIDESYYAHKRLSDAKSSYQTPVGRESDIKKSKLYIELMNADLAIVRSCDCIFMLKGWEHSVGAKKELAEAINNGLEVILQKPEEV